jgi:hypothetical protein
MSSLMYEMAWELKPLHNFKALNEAASKLFFEDGLLIGFYLKIGCREKNTMFHTYIYVLVKLKYIEEIAYFLFLNYLHYICF